MKNGRSWIGSKRGSPLVLGPGQGPRNFFLGPYIRCVNLPMVLCMGFAQGFRHDGFLPMVFYRYGHGNYDYILIQG